jgi:hypothetical protein
LALSSGNDATLAFLRLLNAREVLIDVVGKQPAQWHIVTAQHNDVTLFGSP